MAGINRKAIGRPANQQHLFRGVAPQLLHQACGQGMVMILPARLHMGVILIQAEVNVAALGLIIPGRVPIPKFSGPRLKRHSIHRHTEEGPPHWHRTDSHLRIQRHPKRILLRRDRVWIPTVGKGAGGMIGYPVGFNDAPAAFLPDTDLRSFQGGRHEGNAGYRKNEAGTCLHASFKQPGRLQVTDLYPGLTKM